MSENLVPSSVEDSRAVRNRSSRWLLSSAQCRIFRSLAWPKARQSIDLCFPSAVSALNSKIAAILDTARRMWCRSDISSTATLFRPSSRRGIVLARMSEDVVATSSILFMSASGMRKIVFVPLAVASKQSVESICVDLYRKV